MLKLVQLGRTAVWYWATVSMGRSCKLNPAASLQVVFDSVHRPVIALDWAACVL